MSLEKATSYATQAVRAHNQQESTKNIERAIEELSKVIRDLEIRVSNLEMREVS